MPVLWFVVSCTGEAAMEHDVRLLGDDELLVGLSELVRADGVLTARMLVHLGEVDARGLFRDRAWSSMFEYAVSELHMSESQAYLRIYAARLGRQFPLVVELIGQGSVHLSAVKLLGPHLKPDNHASLLELARWKSKREVELLVAELAPKPDVPSGMRKLPVRRAVRAQPQQAPMPAASARDDSSFALSAAPPSSAPLSPGRYKVQLTAGQALHDKLEQLKDLLRHQIPDGDLALVIERAADVLIEKLMKERYGQARVRKSSSPKRAKRTRKSNSRYIARAVAREVHERDAGQCAFVSSDGRRCSARGGLELHHHEVPYARGGEATAENLKLMCRAHNALLAERDYGKTFMQAKLRDARLERRRPSRAFGPERVPT